MKYRPSHFAARLGPRLGPGRRHGVDRQLVHVALDVGGRAPNGRWGVPPRLLLLLLGRVRRCQGAQTQTTLPLDARG